LQLLSPELSDAPRTTSALFNDFDGDGRLDLFATHQFPLGNQYFTGVLTDAFADGTELASTLRSGPDSYAAASLDYDSDGDQDIYVCYLDWPNLLHRNDGNGLFTQVAGELGADHDGRGVKKLIRSHEHLFRARRRHSYRTDGIPSAGWKGKSSLIMGRFAWC